MWALVFVSLAAILAMQIYFVRADIRDRREAEAARDAESRALAQQNLPKAANDPGFRGLGRSRVGCS